MFQKNTEDELNAVREQLSKAVTERDRLKKALEGGQFIGCIVYLFSLE